MGQDCSSLVRFVELLVEWLREYAPLFPCYYGHLAELAVHHQAIAGTAWDEVLRRYPDEALVIAIQRRLPYGDYAFEVLWHDRSHEECCLRFFQGRMRGNQEAADELTQEVCIAVWSGRGFDPELGPFRSYLRGIAANRLKDWYAKRLQEQAGTDIDWGGIPEPNDRSWFAGRYIEFLEVDRMARILDAVGCLPVLQRNVLELSLDGKRDAEITKVLKIERDVVHRARWRGIHRLRDQFQRENWVDANHDEVSEGRGSTGRTRTVAAGFREGLSKNQLKAIEHKTPERLYAEVAADLGDDPEEVFEWFFKGVGRLMDYSENVQWLKDHPQSLGHVALSDHERETLEDALAGTSVSETARKLEIREGKVVRIRNDAIRRLRGFDN